MKRTFPIIRVCPRRTGIPRDAFPALAEGPAERLSDLVGLDAAGDPAHLRADAHTHLLLNTERRNRIRKTIGKKESPSV